jgi:plasmid stabilization system protein ParE
LAEYKVIIEHPAQKDLQGLLRYISDTLKEPVIARRVYTLIREQILTLNKMPFRNNIVQEQPYATMEVHKLLVENYIMFYIINEEKCEVHILHILYNRREWQNIL